MTTGTNHAAPAPPEMLLAVIDGLDPSATNPRKEFKDGPLRELATSIEALGVLQPLVVRRKGGRLEIIAGERRWRAAKIAKLTHVPVVVNQLTDLQVLEAQLIENGQREDIHPIEAADTFVALKKLDGTYTPKAIAARIGKSERYVQNVLHYAVLAPRAKEAFLTGKINAGHADLIARLGAVDQELALKACFSGLFGDDKANGVISVRELDHWIKDNIKLELKKGAPELDMFPELRKVVDAASDDKPIALLQVARGSGYGVKVPAGVLESTRWRDAKRGGKCKYAERAVVVTGSDRGHLIDICRASTKCGKHWYISKPSTASSTGPKKASPQAKAAEKKAAEKRKVEIGREQLRNKVLTAVMTRFKKIAPKKPTDKMLPLLVAAVVWDAAKSSATWQTVNVEAADRALEDCFGEKQYQEFAKIFKPLGIDFAALEQELEPKKPLGTLSKADKAFIHKLHPKKKATKKPARKAGAKK